MFNKKESKSNNISDNNTEVMLETNQNLTPEQKLFMEQYNNSKKNKKKNARSSKFRDKLEMYEMIIANLIAGKSIIEPSEKLDNSQISIGFSNIASATQLTKYFVITKFPDFLKPGLIELIRGKCSREGLKINFYFYCTPHIINWDSPEMKNRMSVWRQYSKEHTGNIDVFAYRAQRGEALARYRIINSTKYLNEAESEYKRTFINTRFIITISANRDIQSLTNMGEAIKTLKSLCRTSDMKIVELSINMIDWVRTLSIFSLSNIRETLSKLPNKLVTDDILANFNQYKQGRIGIDGVPLGIDVDTLSPVLKKFKEDPDGADNWLISAGTGGGKSYWIKTLLTYLMAEGFIVCVMDYEGDEYTNLANYIKAGNPTDVKIVSMGKSSTVYFDPCELPDLVGVPQVDDELKESAINFIIAIFRIIVHGNKGDLTKEESKVISLAIQRMYDTAGVTDNKETWKNSKGLRLRYIYEEIKDMVESKELVDDESDNVKHKAAVSITDAASIYFEPGEAKSGTFKHPLSANSLFSAKMIVFSFGMKGAEEKTIDKALLGLKQLSVSYVNILISNYCKYVRHCFNVKVWEEFQRWSAVEGSSSIIANVITGGRKRGDVNFIITNNLKAMLDDDDKLTSVIRQNIQHYAIGKITDSKVRQEFCTKFDQQDMLPALDKIAKASNARKTGVQKVKGSQSKFKNAFCIIMEDGKKAIVKVKLPSALADSTLFKTGVIIE